MNCNNNCIMDIENNNLHIKVFIAINLVQDCVPIVEGIFKSYEDAKNKTKENDAIIYGPFSINIKENKIPMIGSDGIITNYKTELSL